MSASLKPVLGRHLRGMHQLESRISDLQTQYDYLLKERQKDIAVLISMLDLTHLDDKTLAGGLLFIKDKTATKDPAGSAILEAWHDAVERFLRRTKPQSRSRIPSEKNTSPKHPSKETPPPKQTAVSQTTPQPPQKHPREREA